MCLRNLQSGILIIFMITIQSLFVHIDYTMNIIHTYMNIIHTYIMLQIKIKGTELYLIRRQKAFGTEKSAAMNQAATDAISMFRFRRIFQIFLIESLTRAKLMEQEFNGLTNMIFCSVIGLEVGRNFKYQLFLTTFQVQHG